MRLKTTLLLFSMLISFCGFSQSLESYSMEQLNKMKKDAIQNENFEEAQKIKLEIESRKSVDDLIAETKKGMDVAAANEEYSKAAELKSKLEKLEEIKTLEKQIADAAANENFEAAQKLKEQKQQLWREVNSEGNLAIKSAAFTETNGIIDGASKLRFENYINNNIKPAGGNYFDVIIDGKYVGTLNKYYELEIINITPGQHEVVLIPSIFAAKPKAKFAFKSTYTFSTNSTYVLRVEEFESKNKFARMCIENSKKLEKDKIFTISSASSEAALQTRQTEVVNAANPKYAVKNPLHADFWYSTVTTNLGFLSTELPENREAAFKFDIHNDNTYPIVRNMGFIVGVGTDFSLITYRTPSTQFVGSFEYQSYSFGAHGGAGYQIEPLPFLTLQTQIRVNLGYSTWSTVTDGPGTFYDFTNDDSFNVAASYHVAAMYFFNERQNFGLVTELNVALSNPVATSINIGIVLGAIKSPEQQHKKYKGKTLKY